MDLLISSLDDGVLAIKSDLNVIRGRHLQGEHRHALAGRHRAGHPGPRQRPWRFCRDTAAARLDSFDDFGLQSRWSVFWLVAALSLLSSSAAMGGPITPLPESVPVVFARAELGGRLFHDPRLSRDDTISCASCHDVGAWGADPNASPFSKGINNQLSRRVAPTVFNAVFNFRQSWDGRAVNLADQARMPVTDPKEMGMLSWDDVVAKLNGLPEYVRKFAEVYGANRVRADDVVDAIAQFQSTLITPNSPFDRYLRGEEDALTLNQRQGWEMFQSYGCISCHQGVNVGGNMFQRFGVMGEVRSASNDDLGRYEITGRKSDRMVFKVPSLRLAVKNPPYFHDGSAATIEEAVSVMVEYQLGRFVPEEDRDAIIDFLESLVGEHPLGRD